MRAVNNNVPGLLPEMMPSWQQKARFITANIAPRDVAGVLNCSGPLLNRAMERFGAKLGFALHYSTSGQIVPAQGGASVRWFSNFDAMTGKIPGSMYRVLGPPNTLRQGKWNVGDQFAYAFAITEDSAMAAYFSTFRKSFAVLSWVCKDAGNFNEQALSSMHRPGSF